MRRWVRCDILTRRCCREFKDKLFPGKGLPNLSVASQSMNFLEIKLYRELRSNSVISCTIANESQLDRNPCLMSPERVFVGRSKILPTNDATNCPLSSSLSQLDPRGKYGRSDRFQTIIYRAVVVPDPWQTKPIIELRNDGIFWPWRYTLPPTSSAFADALAPESQPITHLRRRVPAPG